MTAKIFSFFRAVKPKPVELVRVEHVKDETIEKLIYHYSDGSTKFLDVKTLHDKEL